MSCRICDGRRTAVRIAVSKEVKSRDPIYEYPSLDQASFLLRVIDFASGCAGQSRSDLVVAGLARNGLHAHVGRPECTCRHHSLPQQQVCFVGLGLGPGLAPCPDLCRGTQHHRDMLRRYCNCQPEVVGVVGAHAVVRELLLTRRAVSRQGLGHSAEVVEGTGHHSCRCVHHRHHCETLRLVHPLPVEGRGRRCPL